MSVKQCNSLAFGQTTPIGNIVTISNSTGVGLTSGVANQFQSITLDPGTYIYTHNILYTCTSANATACSISTVNSYDTLASYQLFNATLPVGTFRGYKSGILVVSTPGDFTFSTTVSFGAGTITRTSFEFKIVKIA